MEQKYDNIILLLSKIGNEVKDKYKDMLKKPDKIGYNAIASGKLYNSIEYKVVYKEGNIKLYFLAEDYWINVEDGRSAGSKYPPISVIRRWILQKKLPRTPGLEYKIQRKISILGIKPRPFLKKIKKDIIKSYKKEIEDALSKDLKIKVDITIKKSKEVLKSISSTNIKIK